jgi:hypothetical protein
LPFADGDDWGRVYNEFILTAPDKIMFGSLTVILLISSISIVALLLPLDSWSLYGMFAMIYIIMKEIIIYINIYIVIENLR